MLELKGKLVVPKGDALSPNPLMLEMTEIYSAEARLPDLKIVTPDNAAELMGTMNCAANLTSKYLTAIQYELLIAKQNYDKRKAVIILDEMPTILEQLKEKGVKGNEDVREALLIKDPECFKYRDRIDCLSAAIALLEGKVKSFVRAFNAAKTISEIKRGSAVFSSLSTSGIDKNVSSELDLSFGSED